MAPTAPEVSLIIPAFNEEHRIVRSLHEVRRFMLACPKTMEVLVVEDGSRDGTARVVTEFIQNEAGEQRIELLQYGHNRGKGFAVAHGLRSARGRYLAFSDADLSAPIDQLPRLVEALEAGADIAIASRRHKDSEVLGVPPMTRVRSHFFSLLSRLLVLPGIADTQCGFKAYQREAAAKLVEKQKIDGYTFDVEHLLLARQMGLKVVEVPVKWIFSEGSQINGLSDSIRMFRDLLKIPKLHPK
jgi:dolichyl-phosphate beta-glucosyltransferase